MTDLSSLSSALCVINEKDDSVNYHSFKIVLYVLSEQWIYTQSLTYSYSYYSTMLRELSLFFGCIVGESSVGRCSPRRPRFRYFTLLVMAALVERLIHIVLLTVVLLFGALLETGTYMFR